MWFFALAYFSHPNFSSIFRGIFPPISQPSILHLGMVTHPYCRNCSLSLLLSHRNVGFQLFLSDRLAYIIILKRFISSLWIGYLIPDQTWKSPLKQCPPKILHIIFAPPYFEKKIGQKGVKITWVNMILSHETSLPFQEQIPLLWI
jgi:hypothetical protein